MTWDQQAAELATLPVTARHHPGSVRYRAGRLRDGAGAILELAAAILAAYGKGVGQRAHDDLLRGARRLMEERRRGLEPAREDTP